jgi:hypothetical protein
MVQLLTAQQVAQLSYHGVRRHQGLERCSGGEDRNDDLEQGAEQLLRLYGSIRLLPLRDGARDRTLARSHAAGAPVLLCRHATLPHRENYMELPVNHTAGAHRQQQYRRRDAGRHAGGRRQLRADDGRRHSCPAAAVPLQPICRHRRTTQQQPIDKLDNFHEAGEFYRALDKHEQDDLIKNPAADLGQVTSMQIKETLVSHFLPGGQELRHAARGFRRRRHQIRGENDVNQLKPAALTNIGREPRAHGPSLAVEGVP